MFNSGWWFRKCSCSTDIKKNYTTSYRRGYYWLSGAFDSSGTLHIAYQNYSGSWFGGESVWLATPGSGFWNTERIHDGNSDGDYIRLMFDSNDKKKIAWYNNADDDAILMREDGSGYEVVTVSDSGNVGKYIDMILDANDEEIFAFYDATEEDLIVATPGHAELFGDRRPADE